jgi:acyl phosphate:glycerol-3-phosphate acyltransferase
VVPAMPVVALSLGYLVGSIPFALLTGRLATGIDIRRAGSGNVGAANVLRTSGVAVAVCVLLLDMAKGAASVLWVARLTTGESSPALAGLAAVVGHVYPVWLRFRGGKGVATAAGVFSVLTPFAIGPAAVVFVITVWTTRYISLGSILATLALSPLAWTTGASSPVTATAAAVGALIVFRHRSNIGRLRDGSERRIGQRITS